MPTGGNWLYFLYVNLAFIFFIILIFFILSLKEVKANWPQYRCNPVYMPFADDVGTNFQYCIQNMQSSFMGDLLQPLTFATSQVSSMVSDATNDINNIRAMFNKIRTFLTSTIDSVFGVFLNLVIEFQKIIIGMRDMVGKLIGVMVTVMYILDGSNMTIQSMWAGPPGQMVQALGACFHPKTLVQLKSGAVLSMKKVRPGDILKDGSRVIAIMTIDPINNKDNLYCLVKKGENQSNILVTGSHMIYEEETKQFIQVKDYKDAKPSNKKTKTFSCLITDTHKIPIGEKIFWDWEDYILCPHFSLQKSYIKQ